MARISQHVSHAVDRSNHCAAVQQADTKPHHPFAPSLSIKTLCGYFYFRPLLKFTMATKFADLSKAHKGTFDKAREKVWKIRDLLEIRTGCRRQLKACR
jgi:hypothetical protein